MRNDPGIAIDRQSVLDEYGIDAVQLSEKDSDYTSFDQLPDYFTYDS